MRGRDVIILADNDEPAASTPRRRPRYSPRPPNACASCISRSYRKRATSAIGSRHGGTVEELWERTEQAPTWAPGPEPGDKAGASEDHLQPIFDPWEDYIVPAFPLDILPPASSSRHRGKPRIGCDPSALAMSVMAAASGALSHKFRLNLMRHKRWWVSPRLWVLLVGPPSRKKTPVIKRALKEIEELQSAAYKKYREALDEYQAAKEAFDKNDKIPNCPSRTPCQTAPLRDQRHHGRETGRDPRPLAARADGQARRARRLDCEHGKIRWQRRRRLRPGLLAQAYDGGPYTVDRISRGEIHIENLSVASSAASSRTAGGNARTYLRRTAAAIPAGHDGTVHPPHR